MRRHRAQPQVEGGHRAGVQPEFRNRLDAIVTFEPLTPGAMETIVEKFILQLEAQLAERHVAITLTPEARIWLAAKGFDPVFGARPLGRVIQRKCGIRSPTRSSSARSSTAGPSPSARMATSSRSVTSPG